MSDILNLVPKGMLHHFLTIKPSTKKMFIKAMNTVSTKELELTLNVQRLRLKKHGASFLGAGLDILAIEFNNSNFILLRNVTPETSIIFCVDTRSIFFCYAPINEYVRLQSEKLFFKRVKVKLTREVQSIIPLINSELKEELHVTKDLLCL